MADVVAMVVTGLLEGATLGDIFSADTAWSCARWWAAAHIAREAIAWVRGA